MALQESFTRTDGVKFVLRQSDAGAWTIKALKPPAPDADTKQWELLWEYVGVPDALDETEVRPLTEQEARDIYAGYMG